MITTIQVRIPTLKLLKNLRTRMGAKSYDEVIHKLVGEKPKKSLWGICGKLSMKEILEDLRDEEDRV